MKIPTRVSTDRAEMVLYFAKLEWLLAKPEEMADMPIAATKIVQSSKASILVGKLAITVPEISGKFYLQLLASAFTRSTPMNINTLAATAAIPATCAIIFFGALSHSRRVFASPSIPNKTGQLPTLS